jgi:hypothetical protein
MEELPHDVLVSIAQQMSEETIWSFLQTSTSVRTAGSEVLRRNTKWEQYVHEQIMKKMNQCINPFKRSDPVHYKNKEYYINYSDKTCIQLRGVDDSYNMYAYVMLPWEKLLLHNSTYLPRCIWLGAFKRQKGKYNCIKFIDGRFYSLEYVIHMFSNRFPELPKKKIIQICRLYFKNLNE